MTPPRVGHVDQIPPSSATHLVVAGGAPARAVRRVGGVTGSGSA